MDNKRVILTILILTIVLSVFTIAFTFTRSKFISSDGIKKGSGQANVGVYIEGVQSENNESNNTNTTNGDVYVSG